jgi:hypothetical protein
VTLKTVDGLIAVIIAEAFEDSTVGGFSGGGEVGPLGGAINFAIRAETLPGFVPLMPSR